MNDFLLLRRVDYSVSWPDLGPTRNETVSHISFHFPDDSRRETMELEEIRNEPESGVSESTPRKTSKFLMKLTAAQGSKS